MPKLIRDLATPAGGAQSLHPRENIVAVGSMGAANANVEVITDGCSTVSVDLRGVSVQTVQLEGSIDGVNYIIVPMRPVGLASISYVGILTYPAGGGMWFASVAGFRFVRLRSVTYTSGLIDVTMVAHNGILDQSLMGMVTSNSGTNTGAAAAAVTLTLAAPGAGLRHYLTYITINRINGTAAALAGAAGPTNVTTTNLPGSPIWGMPNDALPAGATTPYREDFNYPLAASALNTATTIVAPATTGVIWRLSAGFYVAP